MWLLTARPLLSEGPLWGGFAVIHTSSVSIGACVYGSGLVSSFVLARKTLVTRDDKLASLKCLSLNGAESARWASMALMTPLLVG